MIDDDEVLETKQIIKLLGITQRSLRKLHDQDGFPVNKALGKYKGLKGDILKWLRSKYPEGYKSIAASYPENREVKVRGQYDGEEIGIVERDDGSRHIVEGEQYLKFLCAENMRIGKERLVRKLVRGTVSFQHSIRENF